MAVRGDEVAGRIESHVREAIERMVTEIRSSVDDVRIAVDQQLNAALQSVQADVNSISFGPHLRQVLAEFEKTLQDSMPPQVIAAPAPVSSGAGDVKRAIQQVEHGKTQVDILNAMLEQSLGFSSRAALLILKGDAFAGWKGTGFAAHGGNDESVKRFAAAAASIPELGTLLRDECVVRGDGPAISSKLGASAPAVSVLIPMVIKDKISAALYADAVPGDESRFDSSSLELLVFTTGLLIDTLTIRKKVPSPSLSRETEPVVPMAASRQPAAPAQPQAAPPPPPAPPRSAPPPPPPSIEEARLDETRAMPSGSLGFDPGTGSRKVTPPAAPPTFATTAMPAFTGLKEPAAPVRPVAPPPPPPPAPHAPEPDRASTQYIPPPGLARASALGGADGDSTRKHDEAKRFARLLVSEIKLYNESKVEQGRKNRDLYERLKEDIDRSRQMYDERISEDVRKVSNYFYDELVRILADGSAEALGL